MPKRSTDPKSAGQFASEQDVKRRPRRRQPSTWDMEARSILRAEMQRRGFTYKKLALALERQGQAETERRLISRISRGTFTFAFALRCLRAMGADRVAIGPVL